MLYVTPNVLRMTNIGNYTRHYYLTCLNTYFIEV